MHARSRSPSVFDAVTDTSWSVRSEVRGDRIGIPVLWGARVLLATRECRISRDRETHLPDRARWPMPRRSGSSARARWEVHMLPPIHILSRGSGPGSDEHDGPVAGPEGTIRAGNASQTPSETFILPPYPAEASPNGRRIGPPERPGEGQVATAAGRAPSGPLRGPPETGQVAPSRPSASTGTGEALGLF